MCTLQSGAVITMSFRCMQLHVWKDNRFSCYATGHLVHEQSHSGRENRKDIITQQSISSLKYNLGSICILRST